MMASRCLRIEDYTVGWISALPLELSEAIKMLDERHYSVLPDVKDLVYVFGKIANLPVVMACLPAGQYGNESAAVVATDMRARFKGLQFCLLVGIGGGVPSKSVDIRLGDIVVSQPTASSGGVLQFDLGKITPDGFQRTGAVNSPSEAVLRLLSIYQGHYKDLVKSAVATSHYFNPCKNKEWLQKPPLGNDVLYMSSYDHVHGETCNSCDQSKTILRSSRQTMVHYGTIASGNAVIKTASERDRLSHELGGVLCFEMEAAGIMRALPCLVIRGICDYADSHKNKAWQSYAAYNAAAYGRDFLSVLTGYHPTSGDGTSDSLVKTSRYRSTRSIRPENRAAMDKAFESMHLVNSDYFLRYQISSYDATVNLLKHIRARCPSTTNWILEHHHYQAWTTSNSQCLWLTGKIGCGKSIITCTIIEKLLERYPDKTSSVAVLHYYFRHSDPAGLTANACIASLIQQTLTYLDALGIGCSSDVAKQIACHFGANAFPHEAKDLLEKILAPMLCQISNTYIVIDGLDECESMEIGQVIRLVIILQQRLRTNVLISGRESLDISSAIHGTRTINVSEADYQEEVRIYVEWRVADKLIDRQITEDDDVLSEIKTSLIKRSDKMMLWVGLQIETIWEECFNDAEIRKALQNLPSDLNETYSRCIDRMQTKKGIYSKDYGPKVLVWVSEAKRPFTMLELRQALAIDEHDGTFHQDKVPSIQDTVRSCANLITMEAATGSGDSHTSHITLVHHSLRQFLAENYVSHPGLEGIPSLLVESSLSLGVLCLKHLSSTDYTLTVEKTSATAASVQLEKRHLEPILAQVPRFLRPLLPSVERVTMSVPVVSAPRTISEHLPAIFHYARDQWPYLTCEIDSDHRYYALFKRFVLTPNLTYRLHPWQALGQSLSSHLVGLLSWAVVYNHPAMFDLLLIEEGFHQDYPKIPIPQHDNLNAVLLAVRYDRLWCLSRLKSSLGSDFDRALRVTNADGRTALDHAVLGRAMSTIPFVLKCLYPHAKLKHESNDVCWAAWYDDAKVRSWLQSGYKSEDATLLQALLLGRDDFPDKSYIGRYKMIADIKRSAMNPPLFSGAELSKHERGLPIVRACNVLLFAAFVYDANTTSELREIFLYFVNRHTKYDEWLGILVGRIVNTPRRSIILTMISIILEQVDEERCSELLEQCLQPIISKSWKTKRPNSAEGMLLWAVMEEDYKAVRFFCSLGLDPCLAVDKPGIGIPLTPLQWAAGRCSYGAISRVCLDYTSDSGSTEAFWAPLISASAWGRTSRIRNFLLRWQPPPSTMYEILKCFGSQKPLNQWQHKRCMQLLGCAGFWVSPGNVPQRRWPRVEDRPLPVVSSVPMQSPEASDHNLDVQLLRLLNKGTVEGIVQLLEQGANVNMVNSRGVSALHLGASVVDHRYLYREVLRSEWDANLDLQDHDGNTPLHLAVVGKFQDMIRGLLRHGADFHIKNQAGKSALMLAQEQEAIAGFPDLFRCALELGPVGSFDESKLLSSCRISREFHLW